MHKLRQAGIGTVPVNQRQHHLLPELLIQGFRCYNQNPRTSLWTPFKRAIIAKSKKRSRCCPTLPEQNRILAQICSRNLFSFRLIKPLHPESCQLLKRSEEHMSE